MSNFNVKSLWWKFDRYEIQDGIIRPVKGASFCEYRPTDYFRPDTSRSVDPDVTPPFLKLLDIVVLERATRHRYQGELHEKICQWCAQYGLLGVFPLFGSRLPICTQSNSSHRTPLPPSEEFWLQYVEPVDVFLEIACGLFDAVGINVAALASDDANDYLSDVKRFYSGEADSDNSHFMLYIHSKSVDYYLSTVSPHLAKTDFGELELQWTATTLIGSLTIGLLQDLTSQGHHIRRCKNPSCGIIFRTPKPNAEFHSRRCQNTTNTRLRRQARKEES